MIRLDSLRVAFGRTVALDDVSLEISGGITGLFGPNGSGKTTLLRAIAGLVRPTSGAVYIDGVAAGMRSEDLRRQIGYAGHSSGLYPQLTVGENLDLFARLYGVGPVDVAGIVDRVDLRPRLPVRAADLSAGLARRVAVARAVLHDPQVLLLDEPYANLDDDASELVSAAVRSWWTPGRVAVVATHGAKRVKSFAHAGVILQNGRVRVAGRYDSKAGVP